MEKLYYSIGEAAQVIGESTSLVRYWTNEFDRHFKVRRSSRGDRKYTAEDIETLVGDLEAEAKNVTSVSVALATRDAGISGQDIKSGDYIAMYSKEKVVACCPDSFEALEKLLESIDGMDDMEIMNVICGADVTEEDEEKARALIEEKYPDIEAFFIRGNQKIYSYMIGLE